MAGSRAFPESAGAQRAAIVEDCFIHLDLASKAHQAYADGDDSALAEIEGRLAKLAATATDQCLEGLIVENSKANTLLYLNELKSTRIRFSTASDGLGALELLCKKRFDLLVAGHSLANLCGPALIAAVRINAGINSSIRALLISSAKNHALPKELSADVVLHRDETLMARLRKAVELSLH